MDHLRARSGFIFPFNWHFVDLLKTNYLSNCMHITYYLAF